MMFSSKQNLYARVTHNKNTLEHKEKIKLH